jgi:hypothetical protein
MGMEVYPNPSPTKKEKRKKESKKERKEKRNKVIFVFLPRLTTLKPLNLLMNLVAQYWYSERVQSFIFLKKNVSSTCFKKI